MIGAKGLRGNSWPDLDMLPLGWLTDPGGNKTLTATFSLSRLNIIPAKFECVGDD